MLANISDANKRIENEVQEQLNLNIKERNSIIFNAGAGAGKTYALVESLKYVIHEFGDILKKNNQQVICITYTGVAAEEIRSRIGNSSLIVISTIHERIWNLISPYQKELVEIHKQNLKKQIEELQDSIRNNEIFDAYRDLEDIKKVEFEKLIFEYKDVYYKNYNKGSKEFRAAIQEVIGTWDTILKNINNFKKLVNTLFKIKNFEICINNIKEGKTDYQGIKYNIMFNSDQLHRMRISHDTLLLYGYEMIQKYNLFRQLIIDTYPFIFVDEYQDTNEKVVKILAALHQYSIKINHKIFVGYFGDSVQNIYNDGIGTRIGENHPGLICIDKLFNRRSAQEIIDVANKVRNDNIEQKSIYEDCNGGRVHFFTGCTQDVDRFIIEKSRELKASETDPVRCFMLTNKAISQYSHFGNIYECFAKTQYYRKYFDQLNTELLSNDIPKLGEIPSMLYRLVKFISNIRNRETPLLELLNNTFYINKNLQQINELIYMLTLVKGENLDEYIISLCDLLQESQNSDVKRIVDEIFDIGEYTYEGIYEYICTSLFPDIETEEDSIIARNAVKELLCIEIEEYFQWYLYILRNVKSDVIYYTCHGTKGLEFDNVIIIIGNAFGKTSHYFDHFFKNYGNEEKLVEEQHERFEKARNLLYVATSRAVKNLYILYVDDILEFEDSVINIFGGIQKYVSDNPVEIM